MLGLEFSLNLLDLSNLGLLIYLLARWGRRTHLVEAFDIELSYDLLVRNV